MVRLDLLVPDLTMSDVFGATNKRIQYAGMSRKSQVLSLMSLDIVIGRQIGEGGFALVYKGEWNGKYGKLPMFWFCPDWSGWWL